jgi:DNA-directed RNA polymerase specialized sigma24 family protein
MAAYVSSGVTATARLLADAGTLRLLSTFVRRRVPAGAGDDVVQSVLCSALETGGPDGEVRPWLLGIARHKIADFHRRAARERRGAAAEHPARSDPHEARDLLVRAHAMLDASEKRTLEWIVRAHEGEALEEIARAEALAPATVRQRVTRLRRVLRRALLAAAVVAVALVARRAPQDVIRPDGGSRAGAAGGDVLGLVQGRWRTSDVSCAPSVPRAACALATRARVEVHGARARLFVGALERDARLERDGAAVRVVDGDGPPHEVRVTPHGDALVLSSDLGSVTLTRE